MRLATLLGPDLHETLARDPESLREALEDFHIEDVAELLNDLPEEDAVQVVRILPHAVAADVLERVDPELQTRIVERLEVPEAAKILSEVASDDRADVMQSLRPPVAEEILSHIEQVKPDIAEDVRELIAYDKETAGGLMTTAYLALGPEMKVWEAIEEVRRVTKTREVETIYYIYIVAYSHKLVGVASLRDLILSDPGQSLAEIMTENVVRVLPTADQEEVARTIAKYDLSAVPVVGEDGVLLGVVTVDDVVDVVIEEATEDAQKMGAVEPMEDTYFETAFFTFVRKRASWLIVLFLGELLTATVMERYEAGIAMMVDLIIFIPLIISSGGNSGSQSSSLVIRALAVGEVTPRDWFKVFGRELAVGVTLGLILGAVGFARAFLMGQHASLALSLTVASSLIAVVTLGTIVGSVLPLLIKRLGVDPAVASTPFVASLVDVLGLVVYFSIARVALGLV